MLHHFFRREHGQGLVEYALIIALVAIGCIAALAYLGSPITGLFAGILAALNHILGT